MKNQNKVVVLTETQKQELNGYAAQANLLQTEIVTSDNIAVEHSKKSLELAIKAGKALCAAKKLVKHGEWEKWVKANVPSISKRCVENYMALAKKAEEPQHAALLTGSESLRQAYIRVGIYNKTVKKEAAGMEQPTSGNVASANATVPPTVAPETTPAADKNEPAPAKMKETDKGQYDAKGNKAREEAVSHVRDAIKEANKVNWKMSAWSVKNDNPCSNDEANYGAALFESLKEWAAKREFKDLTREDEISTKIGVILDEVVKSFILANTTTEGNFRLAQIAPNFVMQMNPELGEVAEPMAA